MDELMQGPVSIWHLAASVPAVAICLYFSWSVIRQQQQVTRDVMGSHKEIVERQNKLMDSWWDRHETAEEKHRETQEKQTLALIELSDNVALNSVALRRLADKVQAEIPTLESLAHEVYTMAHNDPTADLGIGVPGGRFDPDLTFSAAKLQQAGETAAWTHARYGIPDVHNVGVRGKGAVVVVVDTGVDGNHPDLASNLDLGRSRSFVPNQALHDANGHGTHCGGIVAADNQGIGTLGVAPDATVIHCKGLSNQGSGDGNWLANAIRHAADLPGHKIFSLSFGASSEDPRISAAIRHAVSKGHWVVAAAGNNGPGSINWPGALPEVVCVGALDRDDRVAKFSSANDNVDVGFGGVDILSTIPGNRYAEYSGTSMATPGVAGVLALAVGELLKAGQPIPSQQVMADALYATCKDVGAPGRDPGAGYGLVQPAEFIRRLVGGVIPPVPKPEPVRIAVPAGAKFVEVSFA